MTKREFEELIAYCEECEREFWQDAKDARVDENYVAQQYHEGKAEGIAIMRNKLEWLRQKDKLI